MSLVLAAMTSHVIFLACSTAIRLFFPGVVVKFASPKFISLFSFWCPLFFTVTAIFQYRELQREKEGRQQQQQEQQQSETAAHNEKSTTRRWSRGSAQDKNSSNSERQSAFSRRYRRQSREGSNQSTDHALESLGIELRDWSRFWTVRACLEAIKTLLAWVTPTWVLSTALELELLVYAWMYCFPLIQPDTIVVSEARPLCVICSFLGPFAQQLVEKVSGAVPEVFWQRKVLSCASQIQGIMTMVGLLSQPTAEWLLHMLEEGRGLCIPALTLLTPGVLTSYGVVYVQFLLPMARSYNKQRNIDATLLWLQYWVLHAGVDSVLSYFSSILWWIPFSTHAIFCLWCYLSLP